MSALCPCSWSLLTSVKRCCYLLGFTHTRSTCTHTRTKTHIYTDTHTEPSTCTQSSLQPCTAACRFLISRLSATDGHSKWGVPTTTQLLYHAWKSLSCRNETEIWKNKLSKGYAAVTTSSLTFHCHTHKLAHSHTNDMMICPETALFSILGGPCVPALTSPTVCVAFLPLEEVSVVLRMGNITQLSCGTPWLKNDNINGVVQ